MVSMLAADSVARRAVLTVGWKASEKAFEWVDLSADQRVALMEAMTGCKSVPRSVERRDGKWVGLKAAWTVCLKAA